MEDEKKVTHTYMSEDISEIAAALSEFQGSIEQPKLEKEVTVKLKNGGSYKFKYADLSVCVKAAAPQLKANGLAITQIVNEGKLITILSHKSGQWFKSELFLPAQSSDYQSYGSAITYLKRYSYCAILGIVADTDDDANMANGNEANFKDGQPDATSVAFTGAQLQQAIGEMDAVATIQGFKDVWNKWMQQCPAVCKNGTDFYKAACKKKQSLNGVAR